MSAEEVDEEIGIDVRPGTIVLSVVDETCAPSPAPTAAVEVLLALPLAVLEVALGIVIVVNPKAMLLSSVATITPADAVLVVELSAADAPVGLE